MFATEETICAGDGAHGHAAWCMCLTKKPFKSRTRRPSQVSSQNARSGMNQASATARHARRGKRVAPIFCHCPHFQQVSSREAQNHLTRPDRAKWPVPIATLLGISQDRGPPLVRIQMETQRKPIIYRFIGTLFCETPELSNIVQYPVVTFPSPPVGPRMEFLDSSPAELPLAETPSSCAAALTNCTRSATRSA